IFALGCTLYELVSGKRAFRGDSSVDTLHKIIYSEPQPLTEVVANAPAELQRIVRKAMAKDPDERYQSAKDLAVDLRALLREVTSGVERSQRQRVSIALAVAAFLIVVGVIAIVQWRGTSGARTRPAMTFQRIT